jgi:hypothetical protein
MTARRPHARTGLRALRSRVTLRGSDDADDLDAQSLSQRRDAEQPTPKENPC